MKKIKTLLPIATISLLSTSIAPIASCSNSQITITNESVGVTFIDLPISMSKNIDLECKYKIDDPSYMIDETKSDILVSGSSIKAKDKVEYLNDRIFIPSQYVNGNITIKLITKKDTAVYSLSNKSDDDITLYELPSEISRGQKITLSYTTPLDRKIDVANSIIEIAGVEYKGGEVVKYTSDTVTIPPEIVKGNVVLKIKSMDVLYNITNQSSSNIRFVNLPTTIKHGYTLATSYTIDNDEVIDTVNSDILCGDKSIKNQSGVIYDSGNLQIPPSLITNDLTIKLVSRPKKLVTITTIVEHVTIEGLEQTILEGRDINATYTLDNTYVLDKTNSTIICDNISIRDYPGVEWSENVIKIPGHLVKGPITIKIIASTSVVIKQNWAEITSACNKYENSDHGIEATKEFLESFEINGMAPKTLDDLVGATKQIVLKHEETVKEYNVRIIGYNYDKFDDEGEKTSALTFELVGLVSDNDGDYMKARYQDNDYEPGAESFEVSELYNYLNGTGSVNWLNPQGSETVCDESVLTMLTNWDTAFVDGIKPTIRHISKWNASENKFELVDQVAKIFPLTYSSIGISTEGAPVLKEGEPYVYWKNKTASDRIKYDLNGSTTSYWLSTPKVYDSTNPFYAFYIDSTGNPVANQTYSWCAVSFAFCI